MKESDGNIFNLIFKKRVYGQKHCGGELSQNQNELPSFWKAKYAVEKV